MGIKYTKGCGMKNRKLGQFQVSEIGLGCMNLSHAYGAPIPEAQAERVLLTALDAGVTFFDTAALYGFSTNETLVGKILKPHRQKFTLASKCGMSGVDVNGDGKLVRVIDGRPETIRMTCEAALKRLQTDVIDLYYLHRWDKAVPIEDSVGALSDLVKAGKLRAIGLSEVSAATLRRAHAVHPIAAVQTEYSLWTRNPEIAVLDACRELHSDGLGAVSQHAELRTLGVEDPAANDEIVAVLNGSKLYVVERATGVVLWSRPVGSSPGAGNPHILALAVRAMRTGEDPVAIDQQTKGVTHGYFGWWRDARFSYVQGSGSPPRRVWNADLFLNFRSDPMFEQAVWYIMPASAARANSGVGEGGVR